MVGAIVNLILLIPFLIFAIIFSKGKGAFLIAGYNTMSDQEKAQFDEVALCKFMGKMMYGICFCLLLWALSDFLENQILFVNGLILFIVIIVFTLVYTNTGDQFKRN